MKMIFIAISLLSAISSFGVKEQKNKHVRVEVTLDKEVYAQGARGTFVISFRPAEGIHVNSEPAARIVVDDSMLVMLADDVEQVVDEETEYIDDRVPVRHAFTVNSNVQPGEYSLSGSVVYYYCSDDEGWCRKFTQPIEFVLTVARAE